jgi:hypothetical protein
MSNLNRPPYSTAGGDQVTISGANFGPAGSLSAGDVTVSVRGENGAVGVGGALNCALISQNNAKIVIRIPSGYGGNAFIQVEERDQVSNEFPIKYKAPYNTKLYYFVDKFANENTRVPLKGSSTSEKFRAMIIGTDLGPNFGNLSQLRSVFRINIYSDAS